MASILSRPQCVNATPCSFCPQNIHYEVNIINIWWIATELWKFLIRLFAVFRRHHFDTGLADAMYPHIFNVNILILHENVYKSFDLSCSYSSNIICSKTVNYVIVGQIFCILRPLLNNLPIVTGLLSFVTLKTYIDREFFYKSVTNKSWVIEHLWLYGYFCLWLAFRPFPWPTFLNFHQFRLLTS